MTDAEKVAFSSGFAAAWEYRVGSGKEAVNPYCINTQVNLYNRWQDGYDSYQESLL